MPPRSVRRFLPAILAATALTLAVPAILPVHAALLDMGARNTAMPSLAPLVDKVTPAIVNISVTSASTASEDQSPFNNGELRRFFNIPGFGDGNSGDDNQNGQDNNRPLPDQHAVGSGVIVDAGKGYVLTNYHVIKDAKKITVTLKDRREFTAKVIGSDEPTDVALLKIDAKDLTALPIGDSRTLKVGDYVIAVGNPFGLGQTVTSGIVSALGRSDLNIEGYEDFIQTDAAINPGNSGGALVNLQGELVGINTAIIGPSGGNVGIGFAVPTSMAQNVMSQLISSGGVKRGRLGVQIAPITPALATNMGLDTASGALIERVEKGSPADAAGLKAGDAVIAMNGTKVEGASDLRNRVGLLQIGTPVDLSIVRDGHQKDVKLSVGKMQKETTVASAEDRPTLQGASFSDDGNKGVSVNDVTRGSPAWQLGLRPDDVIVAVNRKPVHDTDSLASALKDSDQAALFIKRGSDDLVIVV